MALTPVLSRQQTQKYCENNYLLVSGLIPDAIAERAEAAMWQWMGLQPDNPESWENVQPSETCEDHDILAVYYATTPDRRRATWRGRYGSRRLPTTEKCKDPSISSHKPVSGPHRDLILTTQLKSTGIRHCRLPFALQLSHI